MKPHNQNPNLPEVHEKSCGVILYNTCNTGETSATERLYLLLHYPGGHWDYPKGHVEEKDDDEIQTASRELREETGIKDVNFKQDFRTSMYYEFNRGKKERVKKTVIYFLAETSCSEVEISFEHKNFQWLPYKEALQKLTFQNAKDLLIEAEQFLNSR